MLRTCFTITVKVVSTIFDLMRKAENTIREREREYITVAIIIKYIKYDCVRCAYDFLLGLKKSSSITQSSIIEICTMNFLISSFIFLILVSQEVVGA